MAFTSHLRRRLNARPAPDLSVERVAEAHNPWWPEHRSRYRFAAPHVVGRSVLDVACGTGYGSRMLLEAGAKSVISMDFASDGLAAAKQLRVPGQHLCQADGTALPLRSGSVEVITSFETIEHLERMDAFVEELRRVLTTDGVLLLSTPNALFTRPVDGKPSNPFHIRELTPVELGDLLGTCFSRVTLLGQRTSAAYGICPYWELPERLPQAPRARVGVDAWKALARLPDTVSDGVSRLMFGRSFYPGENDFEFTPAAVDVGHVLLACCRP